MFQFILRISCSVGDVGMGGFSRVVVTCGAGFIGSCLVRRLLNRGYTVVVLDNFSSGSRENLKGLYEGLKSTLKSFMINYKSFCAIVTFLLKHNI